jgi:hypothetical protein
VSRDAAAPRAVNFAIERITLHGFSSMQRLRFVRALEASLSELGVDARWPRGARRSLERLDAGTLPPGASPEQAAARVAATLWASTGAERTGTGVR